MAYKRGGTCREDLISQFCILGLIKTHPNNTLLNPLPVPKKYGIKKKAIKVTNPRHGVMLFVRVNIQSLSSTERNTKTRTNWFPICSVGQQHPSTSSFYVKVLLVSISYFHLEQMDIGVSVIVLFVT